MFVINHGLCVLVSSQKKKKEKNGGDQVVAWLHSWVEQQSHMMRGGPSVRSLKTEAKVKKCQFGFSCKRRK